MRRFLLISTLLLAGSAMAQQQSFRFACAPSGSGYTPVTATNGAGACNTNVATPDVNVDYPSFVSGTNSFFDDLVVVNDGHLLNLRVRALIFEPPSPVTTAASCMDDTHAVHVHEGDRVGAYYNGVAGSVTVYVNASATPVQCSISGIVFPGTRPAALQVEFFKK